MPINFEFNMKLFCISEWYFGYYAINPKSEKFVGNNNKRVQRAASRTAQALQRIGDPGPVVPSSCAGALAVQSKWTEKLSHASLPNNISSNQVQVSPLLHVRWSMMYRLVSGRQPN